MPWALIKEEEEPLH